MSAGGPPLALIHPERRPMTERPAPRPLTDYAWFTDISTRWSDNDVYGHINNVQYYSYFDTAVNSYLMAEGVLDPLNSPVIGLVIETRCNYFAPLAFPDALRAGIRVAHMGKSSVRYEVGIFRADSSETAAHGHFIHVYVDAKTRRPVALPPALKAALEAIMA